MSELASIRRGLLLQQPGWEIRRGVSVHPDAPSLMAAVAGLSDRKARNRLPKVERSVRLLFNVERVIAANLEAGWGVSCIEAASHGSWVMIRRPMDAERAIGVLDRLLAAIGAYERQWRLAEFEPRCLHRTPIESSGREVIDQLGLVATRRELLEDAAALLRERLNPAAANDELARRRAERRAV